MLTFIDRCTFNLEKWCNWGVTYFTGTIAAGGDRHREGDDRQEVGEEGRAEGTAAYDARTYSDYSGQG
ncbi:hypothetical protein AB205_0056450 [Aquarana catesbeiana]|uniref:Uncharacterized protein n=1 Tax=Aquarana catesbeiana TaxID=8400 RepID=A0A2G9S2N1_AQUCT|nr:hypothetical protein AB205_0056450 [Aquarana catesbeiana]